MDTTGDQDLKLQKSSPELIAELRASLPRFVWKSKTDGSGSTIIGRVRRLVRKSKTDQLIKLLEPFQEWPQLLDPHLSDLLHPLVSAFIEYLANHTAEYGQQISSHSSQGAIPLPRAICKILYTFCKIRGQKVIIRFWNNEPRYLEPMLDALEAWAKPKASVNGSSSLGHGPMVWEERYVMLWWLSHLMLAPFDLDTMSSERQGWVPGHNSLLGELPRTTSLMARRLVHVATFYIGFASKEREAAGMLLARIALKPDLQTIGLREFIFQNAVRLLNRGQRSDVSFYTMVGILSFLKTLVKPVVSSEHYPIVLLTETICSSIDTIASDNSRFFDDVRSSTLARKAIIKVSRVVAVARIRTGFYGNGWSINQESPDADIMNFLIDTLADQDTSVRFTASKAISIVISHLKAEADSVCQEIISEISCDSDIQSWQNPQTDQTITTRDFHKMGISSPLAVPVSFKPDYRHVNPMRWHGFVLTSSQIILHGSAKKQLQVNLDLLAHTVHFEQRSSLGVSVGANVRDAACFGLWAVARRHSADEINLLRDDQAPFEAGSRLQSLANDLVVAATLDPAGNIRRGASAALQEMVGRHPDRIKHGIELVQIIDYHAIALRSKAMLEVSIDASKIDGMYWKIILYGLLSWRGVGSPDDQSRRDAAAAIGRLTTVPGAHLLIPKPMEVVCAQLRRTPFHKVESRHGLILAVAQVVLAMLENVSKAFRLVVEGAPSDALPVHVMPNDDMAALWQIFHLDRAVKKNEMDKVSSLTGSVRSSLRTDGIHEAACRLISALAFSVVRDPKFSDFGTMPEPSAADVSACIEAIDLSLRKSDPRVIDAASEAAANMFRILDRTSRVGLVHKWIGRLVTEASGTRHGHLGMIAALGAVFRYVGDYEIEDPHIETEMARIAGNRYITQKRPSSQPESPMELLIIEILLKQAGCQCGIEQRCVTLKSLTLGILQLQVATDDILNVVYESLSDYTINERGDVGSLLRIEAINAVNMLLNKALLNEDAKQRFVARVCGLAAEKLDKVRWRAWNCLQEHPPMLGFVNDTLETTISDMAQTSSVMYFNMLLEIVTRDWTRQPLLEGYATSAGAGSESLVQATRAALVAFVARNESEPRAGLTGKLNAAVMAIFLENTTNDRLLIPTMELLIFLLDAAIFQYQHIPADLWWTFFRDIQKAHYKSASIPKIEAAVKIYAALVRFPPLKKVALKKLCQMLLHPYAKVRNAAADELFVVSGDDAMMGVDWGKRPKELARMVDGLRARMGVGEEG